MSRIRRVFGAGALIILFGLGCAPCREGGAVAGGESGVFEAPPSPRPEGLWIEARIRSVGALFGALNENLDGVRIRSSLPRDAEAFLVGLGFERGVIELLEEDIALTIFAFSREDGLEWAAAIQLGETDRARLLAALRFEPRGAAHAHLGEAPLYLIGDQLISAEGFMRAARLAHHLLERGDGTASLLEIRAEFNRELLGLTRLVENELNARSIRLRKAIALERVRRGATPPLGDAAGLLDFLERRFRSALAFAPDLERAQLTLEAHGGSLEFRLAASARLGSPLHEALLFERSLRSRREARALKLALIERASQAGIAIGFYGGAAVHELVLSLGGERIGRAERARLRAIFAASRSKDQGADAFFIVSRPALGAGELLISSEGAGALELSRAAQIEGAYLRTLFEAIAGCTEKARLGEFCRSAGTRTWLGLNDGAFTLRTLRAWAPQPASRADAISASPELIRALSVIGDDASLIIYLDGDRLLPSLAFSARLLPLSSLGERGINDRPAVFSFEAGEEQAIVRAYFAQSSLDRLLRALLTLRQLSD